MSDATPIAPQAPQNQAQNPAQPPPLMVNAQYVKDLSFEVPGAPEIFSTLKAQPNVNINLDVNARRLTGRAGRVRGHAADSRRRPWRRQPTTNGSTNGTGTGDAPSGKRGVHCRARRICGVFTLTRRARGHPSSPSSSSSARASCSPTPATSSPTSPATAASRPSSSNPSTSSPSGRTAAPKPKAP